MPGRQLHRIMNITIPLSEGMPCGAQWLARLRRAIRPTAVMVMPAVIQIWTEDGGGDLPKEGEVGGAASGKVHGNMVGSAAGDKVARKLTYPSAQREPGGGVKGNVGQV